MVGLPFWVALSFSVGDIASHRVLAGCCTMKVFGSIPRVLHVRATITAGCSPKGSAIAEWAEDAHTRAAGRRPKRSTFHSITTFSAAYAGTPTLTTPRAPPPRS